MIIDGAESIKLFGQHIPVRAHIHTINGFSAHAGQTELLQWYSRIGQPEATFLVHGEQKARAAFARKLECDGVEMPEINQRYTL